MEYNNYYPGPTGPAPPLPHTMLNHQQDCSPMGVQMIPNGPPPMMHSSPAPLPPPNMRHTPGPPPLQQPIPQQHMAPHPHLQPMPPQQQPSPHPNYHQLPPHTPLSHSASPHPSTTPLLQQQQPSRPSTGSSPMHQQSPVHMNGPSPKIHSLAPQQINHVLPGGAHPPPTIGSGHYSPHPSSVGVMNQSHGPPPATQNFINGPIPTHHPNQHYGQPPAPMNHQPHHHPGPPNTMHHGPPGPLPPPSLPHHHHHHNTNHHGGPLPPAPPHQGGVYMHPAGMERSSPFYPHIPPTEYRVIELNKKLQQRPRPRGRASPLPTVASSEESIWWERFACDFFDDNATLTLRIPGEDKSNEYTIGRTLIPRFFRSYFEGGVIDLSIKLRNIRETTNHQGIITLDCDHTDITTKHVATNMIMNVVVHTEGPLTLEFVSNNYDNTLLIKSWRFYTHQCHEYIDRSMTTHPLSNECLVAPVTRYGLTKSTIAYLKMCMIMEPMQDLMFRYKQTKLNPRDCLKNLLYDKYKFKNIEPTPAKRRKKKAPNTTGATGAGANKKSKANSNIMNNTNAMGNNNTAVNNSMITTQTNDMGGMPNIPLASQVVLQVSEPSMLSADFGDENERRITRLENNQFDMSLPSGNNTTNGNSNDNGNSVSGSNKNQISQNQNLMNNESASNQNENLSNSNNNLPNQNNHEVGNEFQSMPNNPNTNYHNNINPNNGNSNNNGNGPVNNSNSNTSDNNNDNILTTINETTPSLTPNDSTNSNNNSNMINNNCGPGSINNNNDESDNNYQMSIMMNGNSNHLNHIPKSEMDSLKQPMTAGSFSQAEPTPPSTESEAR